MAHRRIVLVALVLIGVASGCATAAADPDVGADDTGSMVDAVVAMDVRDAHTDVARDLGNATDAVDAYDAGVEVASPRDTGSVVDTGSMAQCPNSCTTNSECQTGCPAAPSGYQYCCQGGVGGCSVQTLSNPCPTTGPGMGTFGSACTMNSECNVAPANCCRTVSGGSGVCGCNTPFGCSPVQSSLCM